MSDSLQINRTGQIARIALNRPDLHNAFDDALIAELTAELQQIGADPGIRVVVLTGNGASFSAGANVQWMRRMAQASEHDNEVDSQRLAALMHTLNFLPKPTIARVNGAAFGGGVGLVACCDVAIAANTAKFALSEVKLGLVPAVISPYVVAAIGVRQARRLFLTGEAIEADEAARIGLVHHVSAPADLDDTVDRQLQLLAKGGPQAQREAKALALAMGGMHPESSVSVDRANAALIARLRVSAEGQEGLGAFLDKRSANWIG